MRVYATVFALALLAWPVHAGTPATANDARKELGSTLAAIKESDLRQKELAEKKEELREELHALQEKMVGLAKDARQQEEALASGEEKLSDLEKQKKEKAQALDARQAELSSMISAMIKLKELPPEAVIAMPGKLDETLETARALGVVTHAIEEEAQSLKHQLRELDAIEDRIRKERDAVAAHKSALASKQAELAAQVKERGALVERTGGEMQDEKERIAHLTARSKTLQELVDSLQKTEYGWLGRKSGEGEATKHIAKPSGHAMRSFASAYGHIHYPAVGKVINDYGSADFGETFSKGILMETRPEADVVAPFDGQVVFAGTFRDYGHIVIIRHSGDYHTLLSGMQEIDCKPGQFLLEGEPIGSMGGGDDRKLYMELREDGKPIDPTGWVKG